MQIFEALPILRLLRWRLAGQRRMPQLRRNELIVSHRGVNGTYILFFEETEK